MLLLHGLVSGACHLLIAAPLSESQLLGMVAVVVAVPGSIAHELTLVVPSAMRYHHAVVWVRGWVLMASLVLETWCPH